MLQLQRQQGNQYVARMIDSKRSDPNTIQRTIAMDQDGIPVLSSYYDDAYEEATITSRQNLITIQMKLPKDSPIKHATFDQVWSNPTTRNMVRKLFEKQYCQENTDFLVAVEQYKMFPSAERAVEIYQQFISRDAPTRVNLSSKAAQYHQTIGLLQVNQNQVQGRGRSNNMDENTNTRQRR